MFANCTALTSADLGAATFENCATAIAMFFSCSALTSIDLGAATFANLTNAQSMFRNCSALVDIDLTSATFAKVTSAGTLFSYDSLLANITLTQLNTAFTPASTVTITFQHSQYLTYTSMLNIANWLCDRTGYTARTCTFNTTAWNALTAAEQSNIDTILSGKNWTRVLG